MKKLTTVLSMLLAFVMSFQTTAFAAEDIGNAVFSGSGSAQESALAEDDFVLITGGTFQMGSPAGETERSSDETRHSVAVGNQAYPLRLPRCPACRCGAVQHRHPPCAKCRDGWRRSQKRIWRKSRAENG